MSSISLFFRVHQSYRLKPYSSNEIEICHNYIDEEASRKNIDKVAELCYLPSNNLLLSLVKQWKGKFKVAFSLSGTVLELLSRYRPDVIKSFQKLVKTGCADILGETYYNSLAGLISETEFRRQTDKHRNLVKELFGVEPVVFRNTELIYNNDLAKLVRQMGFKGMLCEGMVSILNGRSPNVIYAAPGNGDFSVLLRNVRLSDDIAFRFDDVTWNEQPLTAEKFTGWIHGHGKDTDNINLLMDYETLGIHKPESTGIFSFLKKLPELVLEDSNWGFALPVEALENYYPKDVYNVPQTISWDDSENSIWFENAMQNNTLKKIYSLENMVMTAGDEDLINSWGLLQSADYLYYMKDCPQRTNISYPNPFGSASDAHRFFVNILTDFEIQLIKKSLLRHTRRQNYMTSELL
jgi:alpha-amylase